MGDLHSTNAALLRRAQTGDAAANSDLLELAYGKLREIAGAFMKDERSGHTLEPTALVHEAYLHLMGPDSIEWEGREHFIATAARAMRRVLVDHARRKAARKRGGGWQRTTLANKLADSGVASLDALVLEDALSRLEDIDDRQARVIELRFFGGLTNEEAGRVLGVSARTVEDDWYTARAWLLRELGKDDSQQ